MIHTDENDHKYFLTLDEAKQEGYTPIKCFSVLQFFTLKGRITKLLKENLEPIRYLYYTLYDPNVKKYYIRLSAPHSVDCLYFFRKDFTFAVEDDVAVDNLRNWVNDGNISLLFTKAQIEDTTALLTRLWKSEYKSEGKVDYRLYIELLEASLNAEDYNNVGKHLTGFRTVQNQYNEKIKDIWKRIVAKNTLK